GAEGPAGKTLAVAAMTDGDLGRVNLAFPGDGPAVTPAMHSHQSHRPRSATAPAPCAPGSVKAMQLSSPQEIMLTVSYGARPVPRRPRGCPSDRPFRAPTRAFSAAAAPWGPPAPALAKADWRLRVAITGIRNALATPAAAEGLAANTTPVPVAMRPEPKG